MAKEWKIYIAECSDGTYYTGITKDVKDRIQKHNSGNASKYTRSRTPVKLLAKSTNRYSYSDALKREHHIKKQPREKKIETVKNL
ncbi:MAG: GIY-YIG nuclease family protein [Elusimicrobiota bacterium]|nr:GIY-YIG nuclease family protein [Elusimicrobiota bacterium]